MFVRIRSRAPCGSSGSFAPFPCVLGVIVCVRSIPVRRGGLWLRSVLSRVPWGSYGSLVFVRSIPVRPGVRSGTFGPFPCALRDGGVRSIHSRAPWGLSGSFGCIRHIPVRPGCRRVRSVHSICPGIVRFVRVRSVHSYAPWGVLVFVRVLSVDSRAPYRSSCLFWYCHPIPVRPGAHGVGWVQFHSPWVS